MILFSKKQKLIPILIDYKVILYGWNIADTAYNYKNLHFTSLSNTK